MSGPNLAHSVRQRLLNLAHARRESFDLILLRYANERLLYRIGRSEHADRFLLKGATLFLLWNENLPHRPTRDVDLLAVGGAAGDLRGVFRTVCAMEAADGIAFHAASIAVAPIREEQRYGGQRVTLMAGLHGARIPLQIDVGYGDVVTPDPEWVDLPVVLDGMDRPRLKAYPVYTVVAEKLEAMVQLGAANSRMKDFYDLDFLLARVELDPSLLRDAVMKTFARRGTALLAEHLASGGEQFARANQAQWRQFLHRNKLDGEADFQQVLERIRRRLSGVFVE